MTVAFLPEKLRSPSSIAASSPVAHTGWHTCIPKAVRAWADDYVKAFHTNWDKPVQEFVVSGDYAFERYSYTSTDTPVGGGAPVVDTGWGLVVYHRDADGVWRVARDAFGPDHPPAAK